jgi:hypothetical protein
MIAAKRSGRSPSHSNSPSRRVDTVAFSSHSRMPSRHRSWARSNLAGRPPGPIHSTGPSTRNSTGQTIASQPGRTSPKLRDSLPDPIQAIERLHGSRGLIAARAMTATRQLVPRAPIHRGSKSMTSAAVSKSAQTYYPDRARLPCVRGSECGDKGVRVGLDLG